MSDKLPPVSVPETEKDTGRGVEGRGGQVAAPEGRAAEGAPLTPASGCRVGRLEPAFFQPEEGNAGESKWFVYRAALGHPGSPGESLWRPQGQLLLNCPAFILPSSGDDTLALF